MINIGKITDFKNSLTFRLIYLLRKYSWIINTNKKFEALTKKIVSGEPPILPMIYEIGIIESVTELTTI